MSLQKEEKYGSVVLCEIIGLLASFLPEADQPLAGDRASVMLDVLLGR